MKSIELSGVKKTYDPGKPYQVEALRGIDLALQSGKSYAIMGASGSGKSTLLNILGCLDRPTEGSYAWDNERIDSLPLSKLAKIRAKEIGFVLQDFGLIDHISALDNCLAPGIFAGERRKMAKRNAEEMLKRLEILELAKREISKLSGGQKQRVAIARAIVNRPQLILADEPTGALDSKTANTILDVLLSLVNHDSIVVIATHDYEAALRCDHLYRIKDGQVVLSSKN